MICYYKEMSAEIILNKFDLNGRANSDRVVLYKSADHFCDTAPSEQSETDVLYLLPEDNILRHL